MSKQIKFKNLNNTRDLGNMRTKDGAVIKGRKLFRSGHLAELSADDRDTLCDLTDTIIDFRTDMEVAEKPDTELLGVSYCHIPIVDNLTAGISREAGSDKKVIETLLLKPDEARQYMCTLYEAFVTSEFARLQYEKFVRILLSPHDKAVLWHCTAGKDRAGAATVIIGELLGVGRDELIADYLKTNEYLADDIVKLSNMVKKHANTQSPLADEALSYLFGARREYIESFYNKASEIYGNFDGFLREGLNITDGDRQRLREMYLE